MSNLFISHSSRDNAAAKELQARLEEQSHHSVFLDLDPEKGIQAGVSWERTLYTKLRACRAVVALCCDSYLASQWCFAEIALGPDGRQGTLRPPDRSLERANADALDPHRGAVRRSQNE